MPRNEQVVCSCTYLRDHAHGSHGLEAFVSS